MLLRSFHTWFVLMTIFAIGASGCSSPPWRKQQAVSQQSQDAYIEQAVGKIQYDTSPVGADDYQPQTAAESSYVPTVSRRTASSSGSCCH